jgi:hypothetical protein
VCSETPDAYWGVPADRPEFQDDYQDHSAAPADHSEFRDDHPACQDAPASRQVVQGYRCRVDPGDRCRVDPVSRVPVASSPGDAAAAK